MSNVLLQGISKSFGELEVVHSIDLEIASQEFIVLVGPSGCGKSTTLRMVAGLEEISDGMLQIGDRVVNDIAPKDRDVAMVFQNYALYPHLSVADNIAFGLNIRRVKKPEIKRQVADVAQTLELTDLLNRKPSELSGGQRQRVAMGRAIVRHPKVFLFDEPLSNLDAKLRIQMRAEIKLLHKRLGVTSVYVTHDQVEAMTLADRIVVMHDGRIEQIGTPMELFRNPANLFVASFIGSPPMNKLSGSVTVKNAVPSLDIGHGASIKLRSDSVSSDDHGRSIVVGIRPEHMNIEPGNGPGWSEIPFDLTLVEPLGSEALIHAMVGDTPIIMKVETRNEVSHLNDATRFYVQAEDVRAFDAETGKALDFTVAG